MTALAPLPLANSTDALIPAGGQSSAHAGGGPAGDPRIGTGGGAGMVSPTSSGENFRARWQAMLKDLETEQGTAGAGASHPADSQPSTSPGTASPDTTRTPPWMAANEESLPATAANNAPAGAVDPGLKGAYASMQAAGPAAPGSAPTGPAATGKILTERTLSDSSRAQKHGASRRHRSEGSVHPEEKNPEPPQALVPAVAAAPVPAVLTAPNPPLKTAAPDAVFSTLHRTEREVGSATAAAAPGAGSPIAQALQNGLSETGAAVSGNLPAHPAGIRPAQVFAHEAAAPDSTQSGAAAAAGDPTGLEAAGPIQLTSSEAASIIDAAKRLPGRESGASAATIPHPVAMPAAPADAAHLNLAEEAPFAPAPTTLPAGPPAGKMPSRERGNATAGSGQVGGTHPTGTPPGTAGPGAAGIAHLSAGDPRGFNAANPAPHRDSGLGSEGAAARSQDAFAGLDAGASAPAWIHAGAQRAEAGFNDPALGWVGVRAGLEGGVVHAAVVPGSVEAAQALSGHIAGLNAHLAEHRIPVEALSMAAPAGRDWGAGPDQGNPHHQGQGSSQQGAAGEFEAEHRGPVGAGSEASRPPSASEWGRAMSGPSIGAGSSHSIAGGHISVIA
jgi:hypothetical protein